MPKLSGDRLPNCQDRQNEMKFRLTFLILLLLFVQSIKNDQDEFAEFDSDPDDSDGAGEAEDEESNVEVNNEDFGENFEDEQQHSG